MAKYTNMAGFKGVSEEDAEETIEKLPRPLFFLIIGGVAVVIIVAFLIVHAFSSNHGGTATSDEAATVAAATEDYDYKELFGLEETTAPSEPITLKPQSSSPSMTIAPQSSSPSMTIAVPQPITQPVTNAPQKSEASSRTESQMARSESSTPQQSHSDSAPRSQQSSAVESHQVPRQQEIGDSGSSEVYVTDTSLSHTSIFLTVGQTFTLSATISPSNATNKSVTWTSSNSAVATVSHGAVKAQKAGTATVYAVSSNGKKASCTVTVAEKQELRQNISLSPGDTTIKRGQELTIRLNGANRCTWSESNPFVVKKLGEGNDYYTIKAAKRGVTNIIASLPSGQSCKIKITVE